MHKKNTVVMLVFLSVVSLCIISVCIVSFCRAEEKSVITGGNMIEAQTIVVPLERPNLELRFKNIFSGELVTKGQVWAVCDDTLHDNHVEFSLRLNESGKVGLYVNQSIWNITVYIDDPTTMGKEYYGYYQITTTSVGELELFVFPVGTVRGKVLDSRENLIGNARLSFECSTENGNPAPNVTSEFGGFLYEYAPLGECRISAMYGDAVGVTSVSVTKGNV
ncbi:hypothetical protein COY95_05065, partial [Candidatus Woesearchaeota archaeon CG_4_10_14_0_8_um_filter_47_5]